MPDSPSRIQKGPDEEHEYLKMHQTGATSYEHRRRMLSSEVKHDISPTLPGMRDGAMDARAAQPYPVERSRSRVSERPKVRHGDAVNDVRS